MKIRSPDFENNALNKEHLSVRLPPVARAIGDPQPVRLAAWLAGLVLLSLTIWLLGRLFVPHSLAESVGTIADTLNSTAFWSGVAVGLLAQAVDGALGMAYGVTATTFLLGTGVSPVVASASVHIAEIFTTGFSGLSHVRFGNVDRRLFTRLLVPGIIGAVAGACVISWVDGAVFKPFISAYLLIMGGYILVKAVRRTRAAAGEPRHVAKLALFGGFVDAAGGGGWGPVVTSSLLGSGGDPRTTIGSVNFAEFFLTVSSAAAFALLVGAQTWPIIAGLVLGGLLAAPFAAYLCRRLHPRVLLGLVGVLITALSLYNLGNALIGN
ncbi:MAG TPA: sulfite exporter TauE/SafE family protein [Gammaproteobacteria bacterium]